MPTSNWIDQTLGQRYVIEEVLGQGGMSTVYRGTDPNLRRPVAIKLIHPHLANNAEFVRRFEEEAAAVARLRHPHIIQVFDFDHDDETYYMVLEYVEGVTLDETLRQLNQTGQVMPLDEIRRIMIHLCEAVGYAHEQGMIHRDLKPANVMIRPNGDPLLMDFGIVKIVGGENHTATGDMMGTIAYMAPEQIKGERPDHRTDLYALGVMLYELTTGKRPFAGENSASTMMMHLTEPVPDLRQVDAPNLPDDNLGQLADVVKRAMQKEPDNRFQSAREMALALQGHPLPSPDQTFVINRDSDTIVEFSTSATTSKHPQQNTTVSAAPERPNRWLLLGSGLMFVLVLLAVVWLALDSDGDGLRNGHEWRIGTALNTADSDGDGLNDADELASNTDPLSADTDGDGLSDQQEISIRTSPTDADTDGDGFLDGDDPDPYTPDTTRRAEITDIRLTMANIQPTDTNSMYGNTNPAPSSANPNEPTPHYEIEFTTNFTPTALGDHVHFFFDTVPQREAGFGGSGPWTVYAGNSPFVDPNHTPATRPVGATQLCVIVAREDHRVIPGTGNCFLLPAAEISPLGE